MIYTCDTKCCHFIFFGSAETRVCPDCGKQIEVFGKSKIDSGAKELGLPVLAKLPIDPLVAQAMDEGLLEHAKVDAIAPAADALEKL